MAGDHTDDLAVRLHDYVAEIASCTRDDVASITQFEEGNRHDVYRVSLLYAGIATDLVVRISLTDDGAEREAVKREAIVLEKLGGVGAPRLIDYRLSSSWFDKPVLTMRFVPGRNFELKSATSADIERLGSVVATVHALPVDDLADSFPHETTLLAYAEGRLHHIMQGVPWARDPLPATVQDRLLRATDLIQSRWAAWRGTDSFRADETLRLIHGDIAFGNVLWDLHPVLIDWEYARLGDPSDEIAYLFDQNGLSAPQRDAFWRGYQTRAEHTVSLAHLMERASWWEPLTLLGSTLWWVERFVRSTEAKADATSDPAVAREPRYYFDHAVSRLDRLEQMIGTT